MVWYHTSNNNVTYINHHSKAGRQTGTLNSIIIMHHHQHQHHKNYNTSILDSFYTKQQGYTAKRTFQTNDTTYYQTTHLLQRRLINNNKYIHKLKKLLLTKIKPKNTHIHTQVNKNGRRPYSHKIIYHNIT